MPIIRLDDCPGGVFGSNTQFVLHLFVEVLQQNLAGLDHRFIDLARQIKLQLFKASLDRIVVAAVLIDLGDAPLDAGVRMPTPGGRQGKGLVGATFLALAVLGFALALYFDAIDLGTLLDRKDSPAASGQGGVPQIVQPLPQPVAAARPSAPAAGTAEAKPADPSDQATPKPGVHQLIFSFDGSSWVEVKDAAGRTLFSQMNAKGTTQVIEGHPPFQLVVGNASNVRLQYDEQAVDLRPHTRVEVARLTLE